MSQDGLTNQQTGPDALALLRLYIEWGADEAIEPTPQSRFGATGGTLPAAAPVFRPAPAAAPRQLAEKPASARFESAPPPSLAPGKPLGPLDQAAVASAREAAASAPDLAALRAALERFDGVALRKTATNLVFADGNPAAGSCWWARRRGRMRTGWGLPFVGVSGQLLDRMMAAIGLDRTTFYITNVCFWRPPGNRKPTDAELAAQKPFVERHIELVAPQVLVLVGAAAAQGLLQTTEESPAFEGAGSSTGRGDSPTPFPPCRFSTPLTCCDNQHKSVKRGATCYG